MSSNRCLGVGDHLGPRSVASLLVHPICQCLVQDRLELASFRGRDVTDLFKEFRTSLRGELLHPIMIHLDMS